MILNFISLGVIGPAQIVLVLVFPVGIFLLAYYLGKKSGYNKRVKEENK
ncbi:MAG: hypothetical protein ACI8WA_001576 [Polaribacter sp.]|jgi:hypothetical protein